MMSITFTRVAARLTLRPTSIRFQSLAADARHDHRSEILRCALDRVPCEGWTEDALALGVLDANLPPTSIGLIKHRSSDLVSFFMTECNRRLDDELSLNYVPSWDDSTNISLRKKLGASIRLRLEMVRPYVESNRWHEGMAIGVQNSLETARQLESLVDIICKHVGGNFDPVQRAAIGGVYIATELHMLTDKSTGYEDTWVFMDDRIGDLESLAEVKNNLVSNPFGVMPPINPVAMAAMGHVVSSLTGAVVSLAIPAARGTVSAVTQMMSTSGHNELYASPLKNKVSESSSRDDDILYDLPPFETNGEGSNNKQAS